MTISRSSLAILALVGAAVLPCEAVSAQSGSDQCGNINPFAQRACAGKRVAGKERSLSKVYQKALQSVSESFVKYGATDSRTNPRFLRRAQTHWKIFVEDNCKVEAAFGGGSNPSISDREMDCYERELDIRIKFLRQLSDRSFGIG